MTTTATRDDRTLTSREAAELLGVKVQTLSKWRCYGSGPAFLKYGHRTVRYRESDVLQWLDRQRHTTGGDSPFLDS